MALALAPTIVVCTQHVKVLGAKHVSNPGFVIICTSRSIKNMLTPIVL